MTEINREKLDDLPINLSIKLRNLMSNMLKSKPPTRDKFSVATTGLATVMMKDNNISVFYKKMLMTSLTLEIGISPAYQTRERDNVYVPEKTTFNSAFRVLELTLMTSKTKETAFQILNRTIWTNNKAFKSRLRDDPGCEWCGDIETMEHLLYGCPNHTILLWAETSVLLTEVISREAERPIARIQLTPREIIFNAPHPSLLLHIGDAKIRETILLFIQELKRDIIYRRMNIKEHQKNKMMSIVRIHAHLLSIIGKIDSQLSYKGLLENKTSLALLKKMKSQLITMVP